MATYTTQLDTAWGPDHAFDYLATFSNAAEWDPGVRAAERLDAGPVGEGSAFALMIPMAGRIVRFDYRIVEFDRPHKVVLQAQTSALRSTDTIEVSPSGTGSTVRYHALLEGRGMWRLADALLTRAFQRIGQRAAAGLRSVLPPPTAPGPAG